MTQPQALIGVLTLKEVGCQVVVAHVRNGSQKEKRRARTSSREGQDALLALARRRDQGPELKRQQEISLRDAKKMSLTAAMLDA